jgi:hypothetical protein
MSYIVMECNAMENAWESTTYFVNTNKINLSSLNEIETAVMNDDVVHVKNLLKSTSIYHDGKLCNGYYLKHHNIHPTTCHDFVCHKTLVYYGLWKNYWYYSRLLHNLINLQQSCVDLDANTVTIISDTYGTIYNVINSNVVNIYREYYDYDTTNCHVVYKCLTQSMPKIFKLLKMTIKKNKQLETNQSSYELLNNIVGAIGLNNENLEKTDIDKILADINILWSGYLDNIEVLKMVFSQQAIEYYIHNVLIKSNLTEIYDKIKQNPFVDINYSYNGDNIFSVTIKHEKYKMIETIKKTGGKFPNGFNMNNIINTCSTGIVKDVIRVIDMNELYNSVNILDNVITLNTMSTEDKLDIFSLLIKKGVFDLNATNATTESDNLNDADYLLSGYKNTVIQICLRSPHSMELLKILESHNRLISSCSIEDVMLCIDLYKHRELDILLKHNSVINSIYEQCTPLLYFFTKTTSDGESELLLLRTLLKYSPNINICDGNGNTSLTHASKNNRTKSFLQLLKYECDLFMCDADGFNCLHYAIINNNVEILDALKGHGTGDKYLINSLTSTNVHPIILAIDSVNPIYLTGLVLSSKHVNLQYKYMGNNVLHYILQCKLDKNTKCTLFEICSACNYDLLEENYTDMKPLVVKAFENDLYDVVVVIMNKLLENKEIHFNGYDKLTDVMLLMEETGNIDIVVKNKSAPNFYSLVLVYLRTNLSKKQFDTSQQPLKYTTLKKMDNIPSHKHDVFILFIIILLIAYEHLIINQSFNVNAM